MYKGVYVMNETYQTYFLINKVLEKKERSDD